MAASRHCPNSGDKRNVAGSVTASSRARRQNPALSRLYNSLWRMAMPCSRATKRPAKWEILHQAKIFLQQQETHLSTLLFLKETFLPSDNGPYSLDEVKEKYRTQYYYCSETLSHTCLSFSSDTVEILDMSKDGTGDDLGMFQPSTHSSARIMESKDSGNKNEKDMTVSGQEVIEVLDDGEEDIVDGLAMSQSSNNSAANIMVFDGYLFFYRKMMDMLVQNGVLLPEETLLPVVSKVIFSLWERLAPEHWAVLLTFCQQEKMQPHSSLYQDLHLQCTSQISSQEATGTSESILYEDVFQDMFQDVHEVIERNQDSALEDSLELEPLESSDFEKLSKIYKRIVGFMKDLCLPEDYETFLLNCTEKFQEDDDSD